MFSETFLQSLILISLSWTGLGALALIVLLCIDWIRGTLW